MKKTVLITIAAVLMVPAMLAAQTANGTLTVNATVNSSINLVFISDPLGVTLSSGSGTSTATLNFGNVSAFGLIAAGITRGTTATTFTVSTPVDVLVTKANSASANYTLKAQLGAADAINTWQVTGTTVTSAAQATITATGAYGATVQETIALTVPFTTANATAISNTIVFAATAN